MDQAFSDRIRNGLARAEDEHTKDEEKGDNEESPWLKNYHAEEKRGGRIVASCVACSSSYRPQANHGQFLWGNGRAVAGSRWPRLQLLWPLGMRQRRLSLSSSKEGMGIWGEELSRGKILLFHPSLRIEYQKTRHRQKTLTRPPGKS